jgi:hypothetical protein
MHLPTVYNIIYYLHLYLLPTVPIYSWHKAKDIQYVYVLKSISQFGLCTITMYITSSYEVLRAQIQPPCAPICWKNYFFTYIVKKFACAALFLFRMTVQIQISLNSSRLTLKISRTFWHKFPIFSPPQADSVIQTAPESRTQNGHAHKLHTSYSKLYL